MKKKSIFIIIGTLVVLAAAILILSRLNAPKGDIESGSLSVLKDQEVLTTFTMKEIQALPYIEKELEITSGSYENDQGLFRGVPLRTLLAEAGGGLLDVASQVVVRSQDGFVATYGMDEVLESDGIFLAYSRDGQGLGSMESGGSGPFRVLISYDEFGNRSAKYVIEIEVI